jgi:predicted TIM-barrel fold metal-dependent hydrolase
MPFPQGHPVIDLMFGIAVSEDNSEWYEGFKPLLMDEESRELFKMPAQYMFKDIPSTPDVADKDIAGKVAWTVAQMDRFNIRRVLTGFDERSAAVAEARRSFPDRFMFDLGINPNLGMEEVRRIRAAKRDHGIVALSYFPAASHPQCPINDKRMYPIYATCVEEGLPIFVNVGIPGPRIPFAPQHVELVDEVCWFFPELKFVMRHGAEPWEALAVKLMLKYPNLYYSPSAFAPKHYPKAIINYMNSRGADKVLYSGYFPMGLSLDRIFSDFAELPLRDEVWPKFLYGNAARLFGLEQGDA